MALSILSWLEGFYILFLFILDIRSTPIYTHYLHIIYLYLGIYSRYIMYVSILYPNLVHHAIRKSSKVVVNIIVVGYNSEDQYA